MTDHEIIEMPVLKGKGGADDDDETNVTLSSRKQSWSKRQLNKMSTFFDTKSSTREVTPRMTYRRSEIQKWKSKGQGQSRDNIECLKVTNPLALDKMNSMTIRNIKFLIIEDSEGTLTELPLNYGLLYSILDSFKLTWSSVKILPQSLLHASLKVLDLEENHIHSIEGVGSARSLERLILKNNHLQTLHDEVCSLNFLRELDASMNKLKELPSMLGSLGSLEILDVSQNKLKFLPDSIGSLKKLKFLNLIRNLLTNFTSSFSQLSNLEDLQASSNQLSSLSYSFESLTSLRSLLLSKNKFRSMPSCLCSLPQLEKISMNGNKLQFISDPLLFTKFLNIDNNFFTDLPKSIIDSPNIEHLWVRNNQLVTIPDDISAMHNLKSLDISENHQLRKLPYSMTDMSSLQHLFIRNTQIDRSNAIVKNLSANTIVHTDGGVLTKEDALTCVTPEMLRITRFDSFHSNKNCGCVGCGKLGLVSDVQVDSVADLITDSS